MKLIKNTYAIQILEEFFQDMFHPHTLEAEVWVGIDNVGALVTVREYSCFVSSEKYKNANIYVIMEKCLARSGKHKISIYIDSVRSKQSNTSFDIFKHQ